VPFAEASYAADFILNQQNLLRMHNRLVKQERSIGMGRMISPGCGIAQPKGRFPIDAQRSRPVPHEIHAALLLPGTLGVTSTTCGRGQVLTAC